MLGCSAAGCAGGVVELVSHAEGADTMGRGEETGESETVRMFDVSQEGGRVRAGVCGRIDILAIAARVLCYGKCFYVSHMFYTPCLHISLGSFLELLSFTSHRLPPQCRHTLTRHLRRSLTPFLTRSQSDVIHSTLSVVPIPYTLSNPVADTSAK